MNRSQIEHLLANSDLFKGLNEEEIKKIASLCHVKTYDAGEEVFLQGDFEEHLYIIHNGHVLLERSMDLGTRRGKIIIGVLGKGRAFGCWSTLLNEPHNLMSSAICKKPTKLLILKGADLRDLMIANTKFGFHVLERLCFLLRDRIQGAFGAMEKI